MNSETRNCQNCKNQFTIEPDDFAFYEKIQVPAPTWCPECRMQRRFTYRNERSLIKRKCNLCGKNILTIYSIDSPIPIYCTECWWSDKWDPQSYGIDYNFNKDFFSQFEVLRDRLPRPSLFSENNACIVPPVGLSSVHEHSGVGSGWRRRAQGV